jgi:uncharacterized protein
MYSDFNIHINSSGIFDEDLNLSLLNLDTEFSRLSNELNAANISCGNLMILDQDLLGKEKERNQLIHHSRELNLDLTLLVNQKNKDYVNTLRTAKDIGIKTIKFHPYFQHILGDQHKDAVKIAQAASDMDFNIAVCCSYGTKYVHYINGRRLLADLVIAGIKTPIIALHSGGKDVLDIMSIALDCNNVYLETSYSIPCWIGSSVEADIAFAFKKVGAHRCLYGSDRPYMPLDRNITDTLNFLSKHQFNDNEIDNIMSITYKSLFE